ncbi:CUF1-dependent copper transporter 1 [Psilocybe cubensis]|uniref:Copper transport protein n=2 Tax=Psilocybe cubensis TaxID=181762 RepID=A0A8H8CQ21_PSICU|nr:CUF1-dependent copper transporter 1 [Psilocybe cubensis]KAH9487151.1 CUF1-dependent copper transporter 1 [Psilocybe cubensis]
MAHNHGTPSSSTGASASGHDMMMIPYLHFTGGDFLFFEEWQPSSAGAIAGACIGLALLAILERWLGATRSVLNAHWRRRALEQSAIRDKAFVGRNVSSERLHESNDRAESEGPNAAAQPPAKSNGAISKTRIRTIAPFIAAYDIPRGILYALEMLLMYLLMLAVMTFQAAYIISIVLGLGIGEILFGRAVAIGGGGH